MKHNKLQTLNTCISVGAQCDVCRNKTVAPKLLNNGACSTRTYLRALISLHTYSMVQSPSWEANWFAASQEIPRISWNPKVYYHTHKRPPTVPILGQPIYPHPTSWRSILKLSTHLRLGFPSGLFHSFFPTKTLYNPSPHPYAPHAQPILFFSILSPALTSLALSIVVNLLILLAIRKNTVCKLMWWLYKVHYDTLYYYDVVGCSSSDVTSGAL